MAMKITKNRDSFQIETSDVENAGWHHKEAWDDRSQLKDHMDMQGTNTLEGKDYVAILHDAKEEDKKRSIYNVFY